MSLLRRLSNTFRTRSVASDIDREMAFHVKERAEQLQEQGVSEAEARRRARLHFGNPLVQRERTRDRDVAEWLDRLARNVRHAWRGLARTKVFTATVVLTLAVGIGANTAVFSTIDSVLLRPLPFPDPNSLVRLTQVAESVGEADTAAIRLGEWGRLSSTFVAITFYTQEDVSDTTGETPQAVRRATVGPRFLDVVGIPPALGRGFTDAEHRLGGQDVALISDRYWRNRFGADPQVLGRAIRMANRQYTIVGVLPGEFPFPADVDWWTPQYTDAPWTLGRQSAYAGVGRLKRDASLKQAQTDLERVQAQLAQQFPQTDRDLRPRVTPLKESYVGNVRASLWLLFGSVSLLLLIACTNVSALLLTRGASRQQEVAIRLALGSSRRAVAVQLLTESTVLAVAGAAVGFGLAVAMTAGLRMLAPTFPRLDTVTPSTPVWLYVALVVTVVAVLCGLVPAFRTSKLTLRTDTQARGAARQPLEWWLVGVQVALAVVLLAGAGLLVRSLDLLSRVDPGFDSARVLTLRVTGSFGEEREASRILQRIDRTLDALAALPGTDATATTLWLPGLPVTNPVPFTLVEAPALDGSLTAAESRFVSPSYFRTMDIPILEGELCRVPDANRPSEIMVNRAFARRYLTGRSAVGMHLAFAAFRDSPTRILGVVADAREVGLDAEPVPTVYACFSAPTPIPWFLVRTAGQRPAAIEDIRQALRNVDPVRSVYDVMPLDARIDGVYAPTRVRTILLTLFAITALLLACLGIYGTLSYAVTLRRRETALRVALGASRLGIITQVSGHALRVIGAACIVGLLLSAALTRAFSGMLFGVSPLDPVTLSVVVALVAIVGSIAALLPSLRAASTEPAQILRGE